LLGVSLIAMIYPLLWMVRLSLMPDAQIGTAGLVPQGDMTLDNYSSGWEALSVSFTRFFANSAIIASLSVIGNLLACSITAYVLARIRFAMNRVYFVIVIGT